MILMHKDIPVADVVIQGGNIVSVSQIFSEKHLPMGTATPYKQLLPKTLSNWQKMRAIPSERQDIRRIEQALQCSVPEAVIKSLAVSLTDCYWFKPASSDLAWHDVNFHVQEFQADLSEVILNGHPGPVTDFFVPDLTTDGLLSKAWIYMDGIPALVKRGNLGDYTEGKNLLSANEVAAYKVADEMEISHVPYIPVSIAGTDEVVCVCPSFVTDPDTEFVNALQIMQHEKKNGTELYRHLCQMGMENETNRMILFDYIIHNTDRHEKNFGILREALTLEPIGIAPLFDSGSSFFWNRSQCDTKPFLPTRTDQLGLLHEMPCDVPGPDRIKEIVKDVYEVFDISERNYEYACSDIDNSYDGLARQELHLVAAPDQEDIEH